MDFTEGALRRNRDLSEGPLCVFAALHQYEEKIRTTAWRCLYIICDCYKTCKVVSKKN